jgi:predicted phosphodiesterase
MKRVRYGIFSDIHSNLQALQAVIRDMVEQGVTHPLCLGDVVGYNANPRECLLLVMALDCPVLLGNHDEMVSGLTNDTHNFNALAGEGIALSRRRLAPAHKEYLAQLPRHLRMGAFTLVHSSLDDPENWNYVNSAYEAESSFTYQRTPLCFIGHTHVPKVYVKARQVFEVAVTQRLHIEKNHKYLINVGSVGQPRDRDWRASYVIYTPDKEIVEFRRVEYDLDRCQKMILKNGLPEPLAARLGMGA